MNKEDMDNNITLICNCEVCQNRRNAIIEKINNQQAELRHKIFVHLKSEKSFIDKSGYYFLYHETSDSWEMFEPDISPYPDDNGKIIYLNTGQYFKHSEVIKMLSIE